MYYTFMKANFGIYPVKHGMSYKVLKNVVQ